MDVLPLLGRIYVFFGNKTSTQFLDFSSTVNCPDLLKTHILLPSTMPCCQY